MQQHNEAHKPDDMPGGGGPIRTPSSSSSSWWQVWIWILTLWIVGYVVFSWFGSPTRAEISYTSFKQQLQRGNVDEVSIRGELIEGSFRDTFAMLSSSGSDTLRFQAFSTINPGFENPRLMGLLEEQGVSVQAQAQQSPWFMWMLILLLPWVLIIGYGAYARRQIQKKMGDSGVGSAGAGGGGGLFGVGKSRAKRYHKTARTSTTYDDVAGMSYAKRDLQEIVDYLRDPKKFTALGAEIPKGVLLMGPPGTGKTLLARATAGEAGVPFFSISGSEFIEMFVGVGASRVRDMFANAKREAPSIIFIDELDSVGRARGTGVGGGHDEREQTLNQILSEMDGFEPHESVIVIAATNRPDVLDPALTRPGRFDRQITMELPERETRRSILGIHTRHVPLQPGVDLELIAARTVGFSGADLKNLVNEAALLAGRKDKQQVSSLEFDEAADKIVLGDRSERKIREDEKRIIAYHEAGHALMAKLLPDTDPLQKVTIIARGRALGVTQQTPEMDRYSLGKRYLLHRVAVALGGRVSEKLVFNDITSGASNDIKQATRLAKMMVCQWGMSEKLGPTYYNQGEEHVFLGREMSQSRNFSEQTARLIDQEVQQIVEQMEQKATLLLTANRMLLDRVVAALLERETLENKEIDEIIGTLDGKVKKFEDIAQATRDTPRIPLLE